MITRNVIGGRARESCGFESRAVSSVQWNRIAAVVVYAGMRPSAPSTAATADAASGVAEPGPPRPDDAFFRAEWPHLVRLGRLLTGSVQLGEDLAQDAIVGLLRNAPVAQPRAYLRRSLVNASINLGRRRVREQAHLRTVREGVVPPPEADDLWPLVVALPARQRAVLVLRYYEDLTETEIARVLDCRPGTVKSLASRALDRLRQELSP